jgi:hypothetical protein
MLVATVGRLNPSLEAFKRIALDVRSGNSCKISSNDMSEV